MDFLKSWGFWRRALMFLSGALALLPQFFTLTSQQGQWVAFAIAFIGLALSFIPDQVVNKLTGLRV